VQGIDSRKKKYRGELMLQGTQAECRIQSNTKKHSANVVNTIRNLNQSFESPLPLQIEVVCTEFVLPHCWKDKTTVIKMVKQKNTYKGSELNID